MRKYCLVYAAGLAIAPAAFAQSRVIIADRTNDALHGLWDLNDSGIIEEPAEVQTFFNAGNAAGTLGLSNPTAMGIRGDGVVVVGDQGNGVLYRFIDLNLDGDALDIGESAVIADTSNASGASLTFPTGVAFDASGVLYIVNAGNAFGEDSIYRLIDLNSDGDFQDPGEIADYVGEPFFGVGNGPYAPQEIVFIGDVLFLRNSSAGLHGIYTFTDLNNNDRADDPGEAVVFFDASNASGILLSAGTPIEPDPIRPGSFYTLQTATGGIDQLYRLSDTNMDGDAQDPGEAVLVFSSSETGFVTIDILPLASGQVLITDNSGKRVIVLTDLDNDGLFTGPAERSNFFANTLAISGDIRQINAILEVCHANCDGSTISPVLNVADFGCFLNKFAAGDLYANCDSSSDAPVLNVADFGCFLSKFAAGCP